MTSNRIQKLAARLMADRIDLPEGKSGAFAIKRTEHAAGDKLMLVNMRWAFMSGLKQQDFVCKERTVTHSLTEDDGVWMTDLPCELVQMHDELAKHARGHVLVGGLGLGLLARMVARMPAVTRVTVVENSQHVVDLVWPMLKWHLEGKGEVVVDDIRRAKLAKYDRALLDTWQGTGEMTWMFDVVPLRRRLAHIGVQATRVHCWQEGTMLAQVGNSLSSAAAVPADCYASGACAPQYAFACALENLGVERAMLKSVHALDIADMERCRAENLQNEQVRYLAWVLMHRVGSMEWERMFGGHWDAVTREEAA